MNIKEAIEVLKDAKHVGKLVSDYDKRMNEAIDTVVAEVEKPKYMADDMESFAEWCAFIQWIYDPTDKTWFQKHSRETKTTAQLRELWEQERREK